MDVNIQFLCEFEKSSHIYFSVGYFVLSGNHAIHRTDRIPFDFAMPLPITLIKKKANSFSHVSAKQV